MVLLRVMSTAIEAAPLNGGPVYPDQRIEPSKDLVNALRRVLKLGESAPKFDTLVVELKLGPRV